MMNLASTALIMIDFQRDFCEPGGYIGEMVGSMDWVKPTLLKAADLLAWARLRKLLIVHTMECYEPDLSNCSEYKLARSKRAGAEIGSFGPLGRFLIKGEYGSEIVSSLAPREGELIIEKSSYSAFSRTNLLDLLRLEGIKALIIAGVTADVCVHSTLRQAVDEDFECFYIADCISTPDASIRNSCEKMILTEGGIWGHLMNLDQLLDLADLR